jgi:predicted phosphoribosyltransferase
MEGRNARVSGLRIVEAAGVEPWGRFEDREEAGRLLAEPLARHRGGDTVVIGLPRGGVEVADALARELSVDLDVLVSRKLRAPQQPELAIGALAEGDVVAWNEDVVSMLGLGAEDRRRELERVRQEIAERLRMYRAILPRAPIQARTVVVTDDGVATGATLRAAVDAVVNAGPARLLIAVPGGPRTTLEDFAARTGVSEVVALVAPEPFYAVGQLYVSFGQVSDERVCEILRAARERRLTRSASAAGPATGANRAAARAKS